MTRRTRERAEKTLIGDRDVFDGIFCLLIMRGFTFVDPDQHTSQHYYAYDAACKVVSERVKQLCAPEDSGKIWYVTIHPDVHGISETARDQIRSWLSWGGVYIRSGGGSRHYFDIGVNEAQATLERMINVTGYSRETFEELTEIFIKIYGNY